MADSKLPPGEVMGTYNGVPLIRYTADQMHAHAAAVTADLKKQMARLEMSAKVLRAEVAGLREDAERGRYMINHGGWYRSDEQTRLAVLVPHGSDLSCYAMREAAIDAARKGTT